MNPSCLAARSLIAVASVVVLAAPAHADDAAQARELAKKARAHYAVGEYEQAGEAYQDAYKVKEDPALLYNAAQAYRLGGKTEKALTLYRNYLRFYPSAPNRTEVEGRIKKLEDQAAAEQAAKSAPPPVVTTLPPPAPVAPPPSAEPAAVPVVAATPAPQEETPIYRKGWFWGVVGGVAVIAVVGIVVAASGGGDDWNNLPEVRQMGLGREVAP